MDERLNCSYNIYPHLAKVSGRKQRQGAKGEFILHLWRTVHSRRFTTLNAIAEN
jgi:hypothetical protein